jgi:hypothetical protein
MCKTLGFRTNRFLKLLTWAKNKKGFLKIHLYILEVNYPVLVYQQNHGENLMNVENILKKYSLWLICCRFIVIFGECIVVYIAVPHHHKVNSSFLLLIYVTAVVKTVVDGATVISNTVSCT